jgi:hypothetical protein
MSALHQQFQGHIISGGGEEDSVEGGGEEDKERRGRNSTETRITLDGLTVDDMW